MVYVVLVDLDGVIVDHERSLKEKFEQRYPFHEFPVGRTEFEFDGEIEPLTRSVMEQEGFVRDPLPVDGAIIALQEMEASGKFNIQFCTSPLSNSKYCVPEI